MPAIVLMMAIALTFGCVYRDSMKYVDLTPKDASQVEVFPAPPPRPYQVIGRVFIKGATASRWEKVMKAAREEAAAMGADAVILVEQSATDAGSYTTGSSASTSTSGNYSGASIGNGGGSFHSGRYDGTSTTTFSPQATFRYHWKNLVGEAIVYTDQASSITSAPVPRSSDSRSSSAGPRRVIPLHPPAVSPY